MGADSIKKLLRNTLFFALLMVLSFSIIFRNQDLSNLLRLISNVNVFYVILGVLMMFLYFLMESHNVKSILNSLGEKLSLKKAFKFTLIGFFFSAITPAASGGQPMEIYYMNKEGIRSSKTALALLMQICCFQIVTISMGIICALIYPSVVTKEIRWLYILGISINVLALSVMLICLFSKKLTTFIVNFALKIIRIFIPKKIDEKKEEITKEVEMYQESAKYIKDNKQEFKASVKRVFIQVLIYYSIPFFVYKAFGLSGYNLIQMMLMQAILYSTVSSLPLPGAVGVSEAVFISIYNAAFGKDLIHSAMLLNRGINFYSFVLLSINVVIINDLIVKRRERKLLKKEQKELE